jgi:hypothetical protein
MLTEQADLQRPRRGGVADGVGEVGDTAEHQAFVGRRVDEVHRHSIDAQCDAAEELQVQAGGGHDNVGL